MVFIFFHYSWSFKIIFPQEESIHAVEINGVEVRLGKGSSVIIESYISFFMYINMKVKNAQKRRGKPMARQFSRLELSLGVPHIVLS